MRNQLQTRGMTTALALINRFPVRRLIGRYLRAADFRGHCVALTTGGINRLTVRR
ncbi:hypothetical protein [Paraburkholderia tropica]|uniref:hypothetical protein n=1 Tax=Paraburkholderia tropica TaxID=92647 RepID=UPI002AB76F5A|nr:hypothetical protein [Paraburkholderia tropica]